METTEVSFGQTSLCSNYRCLLGICAGYTPVNSASHVCAPSLSRHSNPIWFVERTYGGWIHLRIIPWQVVNFPSVSVIFCFGIITRNSVSRTNERIQITNRLRPKLGKRTQWEDYKGRGKRSSSSSSLLVYTQNQRCSDGRNTFLPITFKEHLDFTIACSHRSHCLLVYAGQ